jgi:hypothetical protein
MIETYVGDIHCLDLGSFQINITNNNNNKRY